MHCGWVTFKTKQNKWWILWKCAVGHLSKQYTTNDGSFDDFDLPKARSVALPHSSSTILSPIGHASPSKGCLLDNNLGPHAPGLYFGHYSPNLKWAFRVWTFSTRSSTKHLSLTLFPRKKIWYSPGNGRQTACKLCSYLCDAPSKWSYKSNKSLI